MKSENIGCITVAVIIVLFPFALLFGGMGFDVYVAHEVEQDLLSLPVPENTVVVESLRYTGDLSPGGSDETVYCLGAMLLRSDLSIEELKVYYDSLSSDKRWYNVDRMTGQMVPMYDEEYVSFRYPDMWEGLSFETEVNGDNYFAVYVFGKSLGDRLGINIGLF